MWPFKKRLPSNHVGDVRQTVVHRGVFMKDGEQGAYDRAYPEAVGEFRYGDDNTIHGTTHVDVQTDQRGTVVAVWFRCAMLPFQQSVLPDGEMYQDSKQFKRIKAVIFEDKK